MGCINFEKVFNAFVSKYVVMQNKFSSFVQGIGDRGLIVVIVSDFQIWNKKEHNITTISY